ncbi:drebrin-like protein A [Gigantopelta aegis]|uniref:drebrin-like protein A n=1 Tax=Gigantopelta aegis TaxID=1735272 RepID=UPI001B88E6DC|nr:drebrin-like protein A [Gigantopelta aegis]
MSIDLRKNQDAIIKAYNDVVNDKTDTNWAVFGYQGQSAVIKVYGTGDGGTEEMAEELNSGKIMYAYLRVKDPNTGLPKFVFINWQGEGAPDGFKMKCTQHIKDMTSFLKMIHITINARTEMDVDEDEILQKVAKSSGCNYSVHKEKPKKIDAPTPVGTNYKRTEPHRELGGKSRDQFWAKTEIEEKERQAEERKKAQEEKEVLEKERKEREIKEAKERDRRMMEKMKAVNEQKRAEKLSESSDKDSDKKKWDHDQQELYKDEEERRHRSESLRKERAAEAARLASRSTSTARNFFKQKSVERPNDSRQAPPPPRKIRDGFLAESHEDNENTSPTTAPSIPHREPSPPPPPPQQQQQEYYQEEETSPPVEDEPPKKPVRQPEPEPEPEVYHEPEDLSSPQAPPAASNLLHQGLPPRQDSDEEEQQNWDEPTQEDFNVSAAPATGVNGFDHSSQPNTIMSADKGLCAIALYDYQAADETEITFDPGDTITNIDQIDPGWWMGTAPNGAQGMFPANYVEIIE